MVTMKPETTTQPKLERWNSRRMLATAALIEASLFAAIGLRHIDREAIAFAALFILGAVLLRFGRRALLGTVILGLLALDTEYWMATALASNLQNQGPLASIIQPLVLVIVSAVVLVCVIACLASGRALRAAIDRAAAAAAVIVFVVAFAAELALGTPPAQASNGLAIRIENATFSARSLTASSSQVSIDVTNQDLFWHTFTVEGLPVNVALPNGGHKRITFDAAPGTYTFYCAIPGHRQAGMVGTITVR